MLNTEQQDQLLGLTMEMIDCKSYTGEEREIVELLKQKMKDLGFDLVEVDELGNVVGVIRGNRLGPRILFDGHVDTVAAENLEDWTMHPFKSQIRDGNLYGRGATDMKGALAAMICAASLINRENLAGEIYVSGTVSEEIAEGVAFRNVLDRVRPDLVVIGESNQLMVSRGQRGRGEIRLEVLGVSAHSANPEAGVNAVRKMMPALAALDALVPREDPVLGKGILELTDIISTPYPGSSVIPRSCTATFDRRLLPGDTPESIVEEVDQALARVKESDPDFRYEVELAINDFLTWTGAEVKADRFAPAWRFDEDEKWLQRAVMILNEGGIPARLSQYSFCTNGSASAGERGIPTMGFGPGMENRAHTADEYIQVDQLVQGCWGYLQLMENMGSDSKVFVKY